MSTLRSIADVLIPAVGDNPAATAEPEFDRLLSVALDARADGFDSIVEILGDLKEATAPDIDQALRALHASDPKKFQVLSAVIAGAWLLVPAVRDRVGYPGQARRPARLEEAVDQISDGILDPVMARGYIFTETPEERR
ncbi:MAG: hypothetical protein ACR2MY_14550 [Candidatus Dormibacteria bacterium]